MKPVIEVSNLFVYYNNKPALKDITMSIRPNAITALIGPSGCGKSTFLRVFNRMNDFISGCRMEGKVIVDGSNLSNNDIDVETLRKNVGMVFQKPNPFPKSIFDNVAYGLKVQGFTDKKFIEERVETSLRQAYLWNEVGDNLNGSALSLSGGQQQRLCIARTIAVQPKIILMDEPTSALDPIATAKIEELIISLKEQYSIVIVTHNMQQASRISDYTSFFYMGDLIEFNTTENIFKNPQEKSTENYITGRFG
ncbi:MAG: phosphate ABC transporter ATP-binding protein [Flavobacteriales bacterium]|nr:phosphate ABC transporter ATP-binding protein [Flavobacteriales bacterium]|tara:strand:- start:30 stop:785 length:756 start_codon:yes stop_codon:yes gene_type:complete